MHVVQPDAAVTRTADDHIDLSFSSPSAWLDLPYPASSGGNVALMMLGHETDGPFIVLASTTPTDMEAPRGPAHGHDSDSWRISLIGTSPMGRDSYGPGEFRWQVGGRPYGADGYASGPTGGYHLVMFGDRRGFSTQPTNKDHIERYKAQDELVAGMFGIDVPDVYPDDARGVATTIGALDKAGKLNGAFADAASWPEVSPGVHAGAGIMGHNTLGPLIVSVQAAADAVVQGDLTVDTDVLVMIVTGSCTIGGTQYAQGDVRVQHPGATLDPILAGSAGAEVCIVVADRSTLASASGAAASGLAAMADELTGALAASVA